METNESNKCHYCNVDAPDRKVYYTHTMYYIVSRTTLTVGYKYQTRDISVPRCKSCEEKHRKYFNRTFFPMLILFALGFFLLLFYLGKDWELWLAMVCGIIFSVMASSLLYNLFGGLIFHLIYRIPPEQEIEEYPTVKTLLDLGWKLDKPDPANAGPSKPREKKN